MGKCLYPEIVSETNYTLSQLGLSPGSFITLYVGATQASAATGVDQIIVTADPDGSGPIPAVKDTVVMTAFSIEVDARNSITLPNNSKAAPLMWNDDWDCKATYPAGVAGHNEFEPIWDRDYDPAIYGALTTADDDLMSTTIKVLPLDLPGTFTLSYAAGVKLWTTDTKSAKIANNTVYASVGAIPKSFFTEGIDPGSNDITLKYEYNNRTIGSETLRADVVWLRAEQDFYNSGDGTTNATQRVIYESLKYINFTVVGADLSDYGNLSWDLNGDGNYGEGVFEKMTSSTASVLYSHYADESGNINLPDNADNRRKEYEVTVKLTGGYVLPLKFGTIRVAQTDYHGTPVATTDSERRAEVAGLVSLPPMMDLLPLLGENSALSLDNIYGANFSGINDILYSGNSIIQYAKTLSGNYYAATVSYLDGMNTKIYGVMISEWAYDQGCKLEDLTSDAFHEIRHVFQNWCIKQLLGPWYIPLTVKKLIFPKS